jgi:hypothetical protein
MSHQTDIIINYNVIKTINRFDWLIVNQLFIIDYDQLDIIINNNVIKSMFRFDLTIRRIEIDQKWSKIDPKDRKPIKFDRFNRNQWVSIPTVGFGR